MVKSMDRLATICLAAAIALAMTPSAGADATSSSQAVLDWTTLSYDYTGGAFSIDWLFSGSFSETSAEDKNSALSTDDMSSPGWASTSAEAAVPNALAEAWTSDLQVAEVVYAATTGQGLFWAESWANAKRRGAFQFEADGDGTLTVSIDYVLVQTLETQTMGDVAEGYSAVELSLTNWTAFEFTDDSDDLWGEAADGDILFEGRFGTLTASLDFTDGDYGELWMEVDNEAYVESVPAPAAVLLSVLGLGVAGIKLRKYA
jgi:hypothetical protein